jgi:hypothetical protein
MKFSDGGKEKACIQADEFWAEFPTPRLDVPILCKHGNADCDSCGTSERRDVRHRTVGGRGVVGRLRR